MIRERMEYELLRKFGELVIEHDPNKESTALQLAFERLALCAAKKPPYNNGRTKLPGEDDCFEIICTQLNITRNAASILLTIVIQCPKEYRVEHLSVGQRAIYKHHLKSLLDAGFVTRRHDFYGDCCELSPEFMGVLAFGSANPVRKIDDADDLAF